MNLEMNSDDFSRKKYLIYENIKLSKINGTLRKTKWWYNNALKKRFIHIKPENAVDFSNCIDSMITVLNKTYDKDWDFTVVPIFNILQEFITYEYCVSILYPEIVITNSQEEKHTIKNLIVNIQLQFKNNNLIPYKISGLKSSYSEKEYESEYTHSHLPRNYSTGHNMFNDSSFCIGDTDLQDLFLTFDIEGYKEEFFELLLHTIDSFVCWESLEGVPYSYIKKISLFQDFETRLSLSKDIEIEKLKIYNCIKNIENFKFNFTLNQNTYKIQENLKYKEKIKQIILNSENNLNKKYLVVKENGVYKTFADCDSILHCIKFNSYTYIQDKKLIAEIYKDEDTGVLLNNFQIHPKLLSALTQKLETQINYDTIRKSTINAYNKSRGYTNSIEQDSAFV